MKSSRKKLVLFIAFIFLVFIGVLASVPIRQNAVLRSLENEVANISLPKNIEKIAIKRAIGDSGGNGNYSTFRVVMVIKTDLDLNELIETIKNMNLHFIKHYKNSDNIPIFYISHCESSTFQSPRDFILSFDELNEIIDYSNYYFIEFVE